MFEDDQDIQEQAVLFYNSLYQEKEAWCPKFDGLAIDSIRIEDRVLIERKFDKEEILQVIQSSKGDKALDGFTMGFFQKCWRVVESDVMVVFELFHEFYTFEKSLNATFLSLIPKKQNAQKIKDFHPISLMAIFTS